MLWVLGGGGGVSRGKKLAGRGTHARAHTGTVAGN